MAKIKGIQLKAEELLVADLLDMTSLEKAFKHYQKAGYPITLHLDFVPRDKDGQVNSKSPIPYPPEMVAGCVDEEQVKELVNEKKPGKYDIYRNVADFIIA